MQWVHVELGAGNYGRERVHLRPKWIPSERPFLMLLQAAQDRVLEEGSEGTLYLNDLTEETCRFVGRMLHQECERKKWCNIEVRLLPGDFTRIHLPRADTIAISHPYHEFFAADPKGARSVVEKIALHSRKGVDVVTYYRTEFLNAMGNVQFEDCGPAADYKYPSGLAVRPGEFDGFGTNQGTRRYRIRSPQTQLGMPTDKDFGWLVDKNGD